MESQKVKICHSLELMVEAKLSNIATSKKIPAFAGMTTNAFRELVNYI
jgi:hypothetical protein